MRDRGKSPGGDGGFGSFSKNYGTAAALAAEAEIAPADGALRNQQTPCTNSDLFWGIKGK